MSLLFQILANKESRRICFNINFGLTAYNFLLTKCLSLQYPKKNMMKQQESSPFTTAGKSFEKNYVLHGYYICVHHEGTICENLSLFLYLYADFVTE